MVLGNKEAKAKFCGELGNKGQSLCGTGELRQYRRIRNAGYFWGGGGR